MGYMKSLLACKTRNGDATEQQLLLQLLIDVTEGRTKDNELTKFLVRHDWSKSEAAKRFVHALSKMKTRRVDLYPHAREIVERIYTAA